MSEILRETTVWNFGSKQPNHTYLLGDSGRIIAYAPWHGENIIVLKSGIKLDKRYRTFIKTNHDGLNSIKNNQKTETDVRKFKVQSKDKEYIVSVKKNNYKCNCMGFTFRGQCKHIAAVAKKLQSG